MPQIYQSVMRRIDDTHSRGEGSCIGWIGLLLVPEHIPTDERPAPRKRR